MAYNIAVFLQQKQHKKNFRMTKADILLAQIYIIDLKGDNSHIFGWLDLFTWFAKQVCYMSVKNSLAWFLFVFVVMCQI